MARLNKDERKRLREALARIEEAERIMQHEIVVLSHNDERVLGEITVAAEILADFLVRH